MQPDSAWTRRAAGWAMLGVVLVAAPATAETAWVKDEVRVNLRTGAGREFRITGALETGDRVEIVARGDGWTQVRPDGRDAGWIPAGFLQTTPPARVALHALEADHEALERRLAELAESKTRLASELDEIRERDAGAQAEIERLTRENIELRAGARWPERLTGAGTVLLGMLIGAMLARRGSRRQTPRVRL